jgi:hypothetical protein
MYESERDIRDKSMYKNDVDDEGMLIFIDNNMA